VERTPSENPVNIKNQWKIPGLGMGISGKFLSMEGFHNRKLHCGAGFKGTVA
jgi:hypothetical protein